MAQYNITFLDFLGLETNYDLPTHRSSGISLKKFVVSLLFSIILSLFQIILFSFLRPKLREVYQPRSFFTNFKHKIEPASQKFFGWIQPCYSFSISQYVKLSGLDAYFFLRYIETLLFISASLCFTVMPILISVNYTGGNKGEDNYVFGLDQLSWSNISLKHTKNVTAHLILAILTITFIQAVIIREMKSFIKIRHMFILNEKNVNSVVLVDNIPAEYKQIHFGDNLQHDALLTALNSLPGGIKNIWFIYDFSELKHLYSTSKKLLKLIEFYETKLILKNAKFYRNVRQIEENLQINDSGGTVPSSIELKDANVLAVVNSNVTIADKEYIVKQHKDKIVKGQVFSNLKHKFFWSPKNVQTIDELIDKYLKNREKIIFTKELLLEDRIPCYHKILIQFNKKVSAYITKQCLLSTDPGRNNIKAIEIHPEDIIWNNIYLNNFWLKRGRFFIANVIKVFLVVFWVIPTLIIGLLSQLQFSNTTFKALEWLNGAPVIVKNFISGVFPALGMILITDLIPILFRRLSILKGKLTGAEIECDIQNWCYIFFFIHVFFIVTVSSSLTAILENLINNPVSIPTLLATNIPKASNFFFSFILLRGMAYCGNNLLQPYLLLKTFVIRPMFKISTHRDKLKRLTRLEPVQWGSIYPIYSILGTIFIIFSVIAPLILIFSTVSFYMILISFKYMLKYRYSPLNVSETFGRFYPVALKQLFSGIYCLEICLIGLFLLVRDESDSAVCMQHAVLMLFAFFFSLTTNLYINRSFKSSINNLPLEFLTQEMVDHEQLFPRNINCFTENNFDLTYSHPSFEYDFDKDYIWLPRDIFGCSAIEIEYLKNKGIKATDDNCILTENGEILIDGPPRVLQD